MNEDTQVLTQVEWTDKDFEQADKIARKLGYEQTAYTSTSTLWGYSCLPDRATTLHWKRGGTIIKTKELGFLWVQNTEDLGMEP